MLSALRRMANHGSTVLTTCASLLANARIVVVGLRGLLYLSLFCVASIAVVLTAANVTVAFVGDVLTVHKYGI